MFKIYFLLFIFNLSLTQFYLQSQIKFLIARLVELRYQHPCIMDNCCSAPQPTVLRM